MKIGILTYHRAENFGAAMQAFALSQYLNNQGYDTEIIDYRCKAVEMQYDIYNPRILFSRKNVALSLRQYAGRFENVRQRKIRKSKFEDFRKLLRLSRPAHRVQDIDRYDIIITGSDQVWNFHINRGDEKIYLLDFPMPDGCLRYSYAASSERNGLLPVAEPELARCLNRFDRISVREGFIKEILERITKQEIIEVLDPSFLLRKNDYLKIASPTDATGYILVYQMTYSTEMLNIAEEIAARKNLKVVELYGGYCKTEDASHIISWGPKEILSYIANADIIFTTSFHGLAFSLIFEKEVWVYDKGENYRQKNLLHKAGLEERLISSAQDCNTGTIDYTKVNESLDFYKKQSKDFLNFKELSK